MTCTELVDVYLLFEIEKFEKLETLLANMDRNIFFVMYFVAYISHMFGIVLVK